MDAFYEIDGETALPQLFTRGPWDPEAQHAGPPAALLGRAVEALPEAEGFTVARFTMEVLRSIPLRPLRISTALRRGGRRVRLAEATLTEADGTEVAIARAWLIRAAETAGVATAIEPAPFSGPEDSTPPPLFDPWNGPSYFSAVEWRLARGGFLDPGPATAWMRMRIPLLAGETPSPLTRVLVAADSGNGISQVVPLDSHLFINTELTVHLHRQPEGEWVCLDAVTSVGPEGTGLAASTLYDVRGEIGKGNQALLIAPR